MRVPKSLSFTASITASTSTELSSSWSIRRRFNAWRDESGVAVSLWSLRGSGSSHFILVVYENYEKMEIGRAIFNSCKESSFMIKSFQNNTDTDRSWNWVAENMIAARAWTTNNVFAKYNLNLKPGSESLYVDSWKNFMTSQLSNHKGSFGMNRIAYGNRYVSHMVYLGADSMDELDNSIKKATSSDEFADFVSKVGNVLTIRIFKGLPSFT